MSKGDGGSAQACGERRQARVNILFNKQQQTTTTRHYD
jgi:hypothetical protein